MPKQSCTTGQVFGRLTVVAPGPNKIQSSGAQHSTSICSCSCGNRVIIRNADLRSGKNKSCGCLNHKILHGFARRGFARSKTYDSWKGMLRRCYNPAERRFKDYGGRGIIVCQRWRNSLENFISDMGNQPAGKTLERIDNSLGYFPDNCRWATRKEQARNRRGNRILTVRGVTGCLSALCEQFHFARYVVDTRLRRGWPVDAAFQTPPKQYQRKRA